MLLFAVSLKSVFAHKLADFIKVTLAFTLVPNFLCPYFDLLTRTGKDDGFSNLCVSGKLLVDYYSSVSIGDAFLGITKQIFLKN